AGVGFGRAGIACWPGRALTLRVEGLTCLAEGTVQVFLRRLDLVHVVAAKRLPGALHSRVELRLEVRRQLVRPLLGVFLDLVGHAVETVPRVDFLTAGLVGRRVLLGVLHHAIDVGIRETARRLDADLLFLARRLVFRG